MAYGFFQFGQDNERFDCDEIHEDGLVIHKCVRSEIGDIWIFNANENLSISATIKEGAAFVILRGHERTAGILTSISRVSHDEYRECYECWSNDPKTHWLVCINAYDVEG